MLDNSKFGFLPAASESTGVTKTKGKERELSFHPNFIYKGFTSLNKRLLNFIQLTSRTLLKK